MSHHRVLGQRPAVDLDLPLAQVPLAQCTIFAHEGQGRPRTVAVMCCFA